MQGQRGIFFLSMLMYPRWWVQTLHFSRHFFTSEFWRVCFARGSYSSREEYSFFWFLSVCIPYGDTERRILSLAATKLMSVEGTHHLQSLLLTVPTRDPHLLVFQTAKVAWAGLHDNRSGQSHSGCEDFWSEDEKMLNNISREKWKTFPVMPKICWQPECDDVFLQISSSNMESKVSFPHWETLCVGYLYLEVLKSLSL